MKQPLAMLHQRFVSVLEARSHDEFRHGLTQFTEHLGFATFSALNVIDHPSSEPEFIAVDNTPAAYREDYLDPGNGRRDPVMQHCKARHVPIVWDQSTYVDADQGDIWEQQAPFGYCCGIALALHMPGGRHFQMGLDRDQALPEDQKELTRLTAELQLFAVFAQDAAARLLVPTRPTPVTQALTPRELECLRWTMEGKTAWELGQILGISEQTCAKHLSSATHKLGCFNKHQAVLRALRLKLIW